jgi:hypothetical protein
MREQVGGCARLLEGRLRLAITSGIDNNSRASLAMAVGADLDL